MFVIFGWGRQTIKKHGPVFRSRCDRCNNEEMWQLYTRRTWFTLFFIPVIPYSTEHLLICPVCSYGAVITREKFEELKGVADCNMDLMNKKITEDEHKNRIGQLVQQKNDRYNANKNYELSGKTETQINYLRQMEEIRRAKEEEQHENKSDINDNDDDMNDQDTH
ncbi:MAG: hypothetical protein BWY64_02966 [bacterium ADurb.Bin363]|nr:MAG: hypothetical protein BWY64_02966 [bacterium ADurb.Bin363]